MTRRMIKRTLKMLVFLVTGLVLLVIAIPFFFNVNKLKEPLLKKLEASLHSHVTLEKIELNVFPIPSLVLKNLNVISQNGYFAEKPLFQMSSARLSLDLKSLLSKKISLSLALNQPSIYYRTHASSTASESNFDPLFSENDSSKKDPNNFIERFEITALSIEQGIVYQLEDTQTEEKTKPLLNQLDADIDHFSLSPKEIQTIGFTIHTGLRGSSSQQVSLEGKVLSDPIQKSYLAEDLRLQIGPTTFSLKLSLNQKEVDGLHYNIDVSSSSLDFRMLPVLDPEISKSLPPEAQMEGTALLEMNLSGTQDQMQTHGMIDLEKAKVVYGDYFKKGEGFPAKIQWGYSGPLKNFLSSGNAKGKMDWDSFFVLGKYQPQKFHSEFHLFGSRLVLDQMDFNLFDGTMKGKGDIDFASIKPKWQFDFTANQIDFNTLLSDVGGFRDVLTGRGDLNMALSGEGKEMKDVKQSATGHGNIVISAGKLNIVNLAKEVLGPNLVEGLNTSLAVLAATGGAPKISAPRFAMQTQETNFNSFIGGFKVENGFIQLPDIKILSESQLVTLTGKSSLDGDLDLNGLFELSRQETDQWLGDFQGKSLLVSDEGKMQVPFTAKGTVVTPLISPDTSAVTGKLKGAAVQNLQERLEEKASSKLKDLLH